MSGECSMPIEMGEKLPEDKDALTKSLEAGMVRLTEMSDECDMPIEMGEELLEDTDALTKSLEAGMELLIEVNIDKQPSIPRVPKLLQAGESEAYKPKILSLGPYHYNKSWVQDMKQLKLHYFRKFLDRNRNISLGQYLTQVKHLESDARMAYTKDLDMSSKDFVEMLLLDCCFVIEIICFWNDVSESDKVKQDEFHTYSPFVSTRYTYGILKRDMLLLENQLPFFVIRYLFNSIDYKTNNKSLAELITTFFESMVPGIKTVPSIPNSDFLHILHLLHYSIIPKNIDQNDSRKMALKHKLTSLCSGGLQLVDSHRTVYWIPCAAELKNARINFVPRDEKERHVCWKLWNCKRSSSDTPASSFMDIKFEEGRLKIPKLTVDDNTETILRNLIAFEQCYVHAEPYVTAYAILMDRIINTEADVELLQQSKVLVNGLGDSKEVAVLFNKLCKELAVPAKCYSKVYDDIQQHCNSHCNPWCAKLKHDYFRNPWTIISLAAAILLIILTITQSIMSILSYVLPKGS